MVAAWTTMHHRGRQPLTALQGISTGGGCVHGCADGNGGALGVAGTASTAPSGSSIFLRGPARKTWDIN